VCRYLGVHYQGGCSFGLSLTRCKQTSEGSLVDVAAQRDEVLRNRTKEQAHRVDEMLDVEHELWGK
jgi:hypothetical protein